MINKFLTYNSKCDFLACFKEMQETLHNCIRKKSPVEVMIVPSSLQLLKIPNILMQPGLVYPHKNIRVISVLGPDDEFVRYINMY